PGHRWAAEDPVAGADRVALAVIAVAGAPRHRVRSSRPRHAATAFWGWSGGAGPPPPRTLPTTVTSLPRSACVSVVGGRRGVEPGGGPARWPVREAAVASCDASKPEPTR